MIKRFKSEFLNNIFILFSGTLIAQLIPFLVLPILQRYYYTPADFGLLALFVSFFELFSKVSTFKLEYGLPLQKNTKNAINLLNAAILASIGVALVSVIIIISFKDSISSYYKLSVSPYYLFLLPLYIVVTATNDVGVYWFNRSKKFGIMSSAKIIQAGFSESSKLLMGVFQFSFLGLILGRVFGFFTSLFFFVSKFIKYDLDKLQLISKKDTINAVKSNKNFVFFSTPSVFLGSLINLVYLNLFQYYFSQEIVGKIGVSMVYLAAGFGVISVSFSQVYYTKIAEISDKNELLKTYKKFLKRLMLVASVPVIIVYLIPSSFVVFLLGDAWAALIEIARIMVLWLAVWFVSSSLSFIFIRLGRQRELVLFDVLHLCLVIAGFYIGILIKKDVSHALWGFSISQIIYYLFAIYIAIFYIKKQK